MRTDRWLRAVIVAMSLSGCEPEELPPFVTPLDAGSERPDVGPVVVLPDAGQDGGPDAGGGGLDAGDAGESRVPPVVDGVIGDAEWEGAFVATSSTTSLEPFLGDRLERLRAIRTRDRLYLAIEGRLGSNHAFVLLLDEDSGAGEGLVLTGSLTDFDGALDRIISAPFWISALPDFRPEYAWGTTMVPFARGGGDADSGWREIASRVGVFEPLGTETVSVCSSGGECETSFSLAGLAAGEIALMVRIGQADGSLSNQTLPMDDPFLPETISQVMRIPAP